MEPTLIVDADDTLWENNIYYEQCIDDFAALMAKQSLDRDEVMQMMSMVERERVPVVGYAPEEFARSMVITYHRLCEKYGQPIDDAVSDAVLEIGQAVAEYPIVLLEGVQETLTWLSERFRLFLLTKGDPRVQEDKLTRSGLSHFFDVVHVVPEKDAEVFRKLLVEYELEQKQTWMIGNSPRSDINPALEAEIGAIYVPHPNTWNLEIEEIVEPEEAIVLNRFVELMELFNDFE